MLNVKKAYSQQEHVGLENVPKERLVLMIYNEIIACIDDSLGALERKDIAFKSKRLTKAINLINEALIPAVQKHQDVDMAQNMLSIYAYSAQQLQLAHANNDPTLLKVVRQTIEPLRNGWNQMLIEQVTQPTSKTQSI